MTVLIVAQGEIRKEGDEEDKKMNADGLAEDNQWWMGMNIIENESDGHMY